VRELLKLVGRDCEVEKSLLPNRLVHLPVWSFSQSVQPLLDQGAVLKGGRTAAPPAWPSGSLTAGDTLKLGIAAGNSDPGADG